MTGSSQIAKIVLSNSVARVVGLGDEYSNDPLRSRNNSKNPSNAKVSACSGSTGLHGLDSLKLVVGWFAWTITVPNIPGSSGSTYWKDPGAVNVRTKVCSWSKPPELKKVVPSYVVALPVGPAKAKSGNGGTGCPAGKIMKGTEMTGALQTTVSPT